MRQLGLPVVVLVAAAPIARAEVTIDIVPPAGQGAPQIRARVIDAPSLPRSQYALVDERGVTVTASSVADFADGPDSVALALVVQGSEVMMGNDTFVATDAPDSFLGYWSAVVNGLEAMDLAHRLPRGSQAMLVTYDAAARARVPMGPAARVGAAALGTQRDYYGALGTELVGGLTMAIDTLSVARADVKVLVVVGDANDTNNEAAAPALALLKKRAAQERIRVFSLVYKGRLSPPENPITRFAPDSAMYATGEALSAGMSAVIARLATRTTVMFPGEHLVWDGRPHELTVMVGKEAQDSVTVGMLDGRPSDEPAPWWHSWWKQVALGLGSVAAIMLLMRLRAGRVA